MHYQWHSTSLWPAWTRFHGTVAHERSAPPIVTDGREIVV